MKPIRNFRGELKRLWRGLNKRCLRTTPLWLLGGTSRPVRVVNIGSGPGQWQIPENAVDQNWICYCVGVGKNATFEVDLCQKYGCDATSFDPTPAAIEYVKSLEPIRFRFIPWAIWVQDGHLDLFSQDLNNNVNLSVLDSGRGEHICRAECYQLKTVMQRLEHSRIDLLKIDIEGAWMPVIENFVASGISPRVFCVEFDSPTSIARVRRMVRLLSRVGLKLVYRQRDNYLFVDKSIFESNA
jgi:FkbM family methyltransferase